MVNKINKKVDQIKTGIVFSPDYDRTSCFIVPLSFVVF